jgi:predicted GH43/DUF377 family glycosyl hydrolase
VAEDGTFVMLYTSWNRKIPQLSVATSTDLVHWQKHGYAFKDSHDGQFNEMACKSGSIVTRLNGNKQVIAKINRQYFMYWGEEAVCAAVSNDLIHWAPVLDSNGDLRKTITPRKGFFDSSLTECGPPAILTEDGIYLFYNGKNAKGTDGDTRYAGGAYCAGQVTFDVKNPFKIIGRLDEPFFRPEVDFEKSGQYIDGTVFIEGLVYHHDKWFLYYGCADSKVGVAVWQPK